MDGYYEAGSVTVKRKGLVRSQVCCEVVKKIFLMFLNARGVHNEEFYNFNLQERLLSYYRIKEDETHHGDKICIKSLVQKSK
jgi:hypothetical protein